MRSWISIMLSSSKIVDLPDLCWYIIDINSLIFCNQPLRCALMWHITLRIPYCVLHFDLSPIFAPKQHILHQNTWVLHYNAISTLASFTSVTVNQTVACSFQLEGMRDARLKLHTPSCVLKCRYKYTTNIAGARWVFGHLLTRTDENVTFRKKP